MTWSIVPSPSKSQRYSVIASSRSLDPEASSSVGWPADGIAGLAESAAFGATLHSGTSSEKACTMPGSGVETSRTRRFQVPASGLPSKADSGCAGRQRPVNGALAAVADGDRDGGLVVEDRVL